MDSSPEPTEGLETVAPDATIASEPSREIPKTNPDPDHDNPKAPPTKVFGDNQGAINMIKTGVIKSKSRHIAVKYHHCHSEYKEHRSSDYIYIPSADNLADIMTKPLPGPRHTELTRRIGILGVKDVENVKENVMLCSCTSRRDTPS